MIKHLALTIAIGAAALLAACGKQEPAAPAAPGGAPVATADNAAGKSVYNKSCALCHAAGVAGAPKPGDKADWAPRIAQGNDLMYKHAIEGFTGTKGMMPPRGGASSLSDADVKVAVDFMVEQSR